MDQATDGHTGGRAVHEHHAVLRGLMFLSNENYYGGQQRRLQAEEPRLWTFETELDSSGQAVTLLWSSVEGATR